jgi:integrase
MANKIRGRNEGSLSQRENGTWRAQVSANGQRISKTFKTKAEGQAWLRSIKNEADQGVDHQAGRVTLMDYLEQWLNTARLSLRLKTAQQYEQVIRKHITPRIGSIPVSELRLVKVEAFYSELLQCGVGVRTVRIVHAVLHRALEKAVRYQLILSNPTHGAALPKESQGEMRILEPDQVSQFLIAAKGSRFEALYYLAITTGMRQGELFGLKWTDLQWQSGKLHIQRQVQNVPGVGWAFVEPKTRSGRRTIHLSENVLQVLREHKQSQEILKQFAGEHWQENNLIFPSKVGTPFDRSNLRADFNRILDQAGLPRIRFHDLRHTAASILLNQGVPVIVVSRRLGHSKASITLDVYGHLINEMDGEAARVMDEKVMPIQIQMPLMTRRGDESIRAEMQASAPNCTTTAP